MIVDQYPPIQHGEEVVIFTVVFLTAPTISPIFGNLIVGMMATEVFCLACFLVVLVLSEFLVVRETSEDIMLGKAAKVRSETKKWPLHSRLRE